jgi:DNA-directed RNA polymerase subunit RPC12/RpoP
MEIQIMGRNRDFCELFDISEEIKCPRCKMKTHSGLDEYDIDCYKPFAKDGIMNFEILCGHCEYKFNFKIKIEIIGGKK